jgi:hypothetical protein
VLQGGGTQNRQVVTVVVTELVDDVDVVRVVDVLVVEIEVLAPSKIAMKLPIPTMKITIKTTMMISERLIACLQCSGKLRRMYPFHYGN